MPCSHPISMPWGLLLLLLRVCICVPYVYTVPEVEVADLYTDLCRLMCVCVCLMLPGGSQAWGSCWPPT